jgi:hypothetical protein
MRIMALATILFMAGCGSGGGDSGTDCTINGQTGACDPIKATAGCLDSRVLCRCTIFSDGSPTRFTTLDCNQRCQDEGNTSGVCTQAGVFGGPYTCGCSK